jgi:NH3-dependent NAD+ synthetase
LTPQRPDEDSYGIAYDDIDDFLESKSVSDSLDHDPALLHGVAPQARIAGEAGMNKPASRCSRAADRKGSPLEAL